MGPSSVLSRGKLRPSKVQGMVGPSVWLALALSSEYPSCSPLPPVSRGEKGGVRVSHRGTLLQGRSAPAQDGGRGRCSTGEGSPAPSTCPGGFLGNCLQSNYERPPTHQVDLLQPECPHAVPSAAVPKVRTPPGCTHTLVPNQHFLYPTWSPKKAECRRLRSPKSPMEPQLLDSAGPALGRRDGGGGREYCACADGVGVATPLGRGDWRLLSMEV